MYVCMYGSNYTTCTPQLIRMSIKHLYVDTVITLASNTTHIVLVLVVVGGGYPSSY